MEVYLKRLAVARLTWPVTEEDIRKFRTKGRKRDLEKWASLGSEVTSDAAHAVYQLINAWLYNQTLLKAERIIKALKMRTHLPR
jgi:hypothetical protein